MRNDKLSVQSMDFAVDIIALVKELKNQRETIMSNQIGRSGTSIGANIREAQYAHGKSDFIAKLQISVKETAETEYWLRLLILSEYITDKEGQSLLNDCLEIKKILISTLNTAKKNN
jgi:four helix bundle protein